MKILLMLFTLISVEAAVAADEFDFVAHEQFDEWLYDAFAIAQPHNEANILSLGDLISLDSSNANIRHASVPLKSNQYIFAGLTIWALVQDAENGQAFITQIDISSANYVLNGGLKVGESIELLQTLPVKPGENSMEYCGINNCISFEGNAGKISRIVLNLYVD